jgi:TolB-like protein/Tfp pilus assembly protein PilF
VDENGIGPSPAAPNSTFPPSPAECRTALEAVLGSKALRTSESQKAFLRYASERTIEGSSDQIKEYSIGVEVFGRGAEFDPRLDPIVRVMARKIRAGLERYYAAEGANDPVRVTLPKGSYVPAFSLRSPASIPAIQAEPESVAPSTNPVEVQNNGREASTSITESGVNHAPSTGFEPIVVTPSELPSITQPDEKLPVVLPPPAPLAPSPKRWLSFASLLMLGFAVAGVGFFQVGSRGAAPAFQLSVGVLPLTPLTDNSGDDQLADSMTQGLIESLGQVSGLQVAASSSSFQFKGKTPPNLRDAGAKLRAHTLLEGTVQRNGDRIRLMVELVNAVNGYKLWTERYDRPLQELPALEREVSRSIASAIGVPGNEDSQAGGSSVPADADAYQDYLAARRLWSQLSMPSVRAAIRLFERAIAKDPSLAQAYAGLAMCYAVTPQLTDARTPEMNARIRQIAGKALRLDSALGEAHIAMGIAAGYEHDWAEAEHEYRVGLALNPGNPVGHLWFGGYLSMVGRIDEALMQRRMAAQLDPLSPYALEALARTYFHARQYDEARRHYQRALEIQPQFGLVHQGLGRVYLQLGMYREGIDELLLSNRLLGGSPRRRSFLAYAYAISGRRAEARQILNEFLASSRRGPFPAVVIADVYMGLGEREEALRWLEKVVEQKDIFTKSDPLYDPIRRDPRFTNLLKRLNL